MSKLDIDIDQYLHLQQKASTAEIAELTGRKKNTVICGLRKRGVLRRSLGRDIEDRVAGWLRKQGKIVIQQRGDAPFDLLVDGWRIDVKSSHISTEKYPRYSFELQDLSNRKSFKNYSKSFDWFYLVLLDEKDIPIYRLKSDNTQNKQVFSIYPFKMTKYPIELVRYLES